MRILSKPKLRTFWEIHPAARVPLSVWWKLTTGAAWKSITDVRKTFPHADAVKVAGDVLTVFNVGGGKFRLIVRIKYPIGRVYVVAVLTHADYDRDKWKE